MNTRCYAIDKNLMYIHSTPMYKRVCCGLKKLPDTRRREKDSLCSGALSAATPPLRTYCKDRSVAARERIEIEFFLLSCSAANIENKCWKMQSNIYTGTHGVSFFFHFTHLFPWRLQLQNRTESVNLIPLSPQPGAGFPRDLPTLAVTLLHC